MTIFSSPPTDRATFSTTTATTRSRMLRRRQACSDRRNSAPAPLGSTTTRTVAWIWSSAIMSNGRRRPICIARLTPKVNRTALRNPTKELPSAFGTIAATARLKMGRDSLATLGFGCFFFEYDPDGWPDVLVANGHIDADIQHVQANVKYAMPPHLFRNIGKGKFEEVTNSLGQAFASPRVGRGAAYADINNDGRLDLLLSTNGRPVSLFRNEAQGAAASNRSLRIKLIGTKSNRDGIGTTVRLTSGG